MINFIANWIKNSLAALLMLAFIALIVFLIVKLLATTHYFGVICVFVLFIGLIITLTEFD